MSTPADGDTTGGIEFSPEHLQTQRGKFEVAETILSLVTFICLCVSPYYLGSGWVFFVTASTLLTVAIHLVIMLFGLRQMQRMNLEIESFCSFVINCVITGCYLTAALVAVASFYHGAAIAVTALFAFVTTAIFGVDTYIKYREWRGGKPSFELAKPDDTHM